MTNVLENSKLQLKQIRLNKLVIIILFFMIWTLLISGIGKVDYSVNNSDLTLCLQLFEKEWRNGPTEYIDIPYEGQDTAQDLRKPTETSKDTQKIMDCSACNNKKVNENRAKLPDMPISKETSKDKKSENAKNVDKRDQNKEKSQNNEKEKTDDDESDPDKIVLNPNTEKSLKSKETIRLTNVLHHTIEKPYLNENPKLCSSVNNLKVLVLVHSATNNFEKRLLIRETWTNNSYYPDLGPVRTLFLLGRAPNPGVKTKINQEFKKFGDVLQGDFIDSYHNLTLKGVMAYKWVAEKCRNAKVILKVDDDVIINTFYFLTKTVPFIVSKSRHIACRRSAIAPIRRNRKNKWFVEDELFSGEKIFPQYCEGFTVAFSNDLLPSLFKSAMLTPFFWIDDVYLYGLVPRNVPNVKYTNLTFDEHVLWGIDRIRACLTKETKCTHFVFLFLKDAALKMKRMWKLILDQEVLRK